MNEKIGNFLKELMTFAIVAVVIVLPIRVFLAQPFIVSGESMSPTFESGQYLIVDQVSYRVGEPQRGDVIVFRYPQDKTKFFIKRVIGLPNEKVRIEGTNVIVTMTDGTEITLDEPYVVMHRENNLSETLGDDEYFVMGDNRLASLDSRVWGPLKRDNITGKAWVRLLPLDKIDLLPGNINKE
jgi:signal peptidase I